MNLKKIMACLCTLIFTVVFVAGCGGGKSADKGAANPKAAENWPEKPITLIVTHGAGGDTDYNARLVARLLEKELGKPVSK